jgi:3',5'-cyclic AMP phosphodiesterase CpdA
MNSKAPLFTFAVITDTHVRPAILDHSSPFPVNDLANDRARYAIAQIHQHDPAFVIHLGDMVHTLPHMPAYVDACREAKGIFAPLLPVMRFVAGNHDIGDKPSVDAPAAPITEATAQIYRAQFGNDYLAFDHDDCVFLLLNSSLVNSGTQQEAEQHAWVEQILAEKQGQRVFMFSHYPPFINEPHEQPHYDNYSEPGRSWLVDLVRRHKVEALMSGHVHQFFFNRIGASKLYCLPPTSFVRQDYADLYKIEPTSEFGRDDTGKFGFAMVDVFEDGHRLRVIQTDGRQLDKAAEPPQSPRTSRPTDVSSQPQVPLTVHLRHAWAETIELPYNGPMEEFSRKRARNDYTLLRLWQMGLGSVRVPICDLLDEGTRQRVLDYHSTGIRFCVFSVGMPSGDALDAIRPALAAIEQLELVTAQVDLSDLGDVMPVSALPGIPVVVGKAHSSKHETGGEKVFAHSVSYGFKFEERDTVAAALNERPDGKHVAGLAFQVNLADDLVERLHELDAFAAEHNLRVVANIRLADQNPAVANFHDDLIAKQVMAAVKCADALTNTSLQLDTFADIDRGYNPRHGLLDRHYNFRKAGRWLAGLDEY